MLGQWSWLDDTNLEQSLNEEVAEDIIRRLPGQRYGDASRIGYMPHKVLQSLSYGQWRVSGYHLHDHLCWRTSADEEAVVLEEH